MKIGIGIDTGGTYTDAVIYDFENKKILGSSKALTTKEDLSIGIIEALDGLPTNYLKQADIISLSTTLATNACVEDRGGKAKLIFFGGNEQVINELGFQYGLPNAEEIYLQESYTNFSGEIEKELDWSLFCNNIENHLGGLDGVGIIEINATKNAAVIEKKAKKLFQDKYDIPVICSHELFSQLNCLQRGASTLLNAKLFPTIQDFLQAIKKAMDTRGITASIVIVRSDGSLMSEKFAMQCPVETLLCGPAASVMGGAWLTDTSNSIMIDMGGTTTDIAIVNDNVPLKTNNGVTIGKWKTFVDGLYIKTFGLGGDTAIHYRNSNIFLEDYRVVPLCVAASIYPSIINNLQNLLSTTKNHSIYLHEHFILNKDISNSDQYSTEEKTLCSALKNGPLILRDAAMIVNKNIYNFDVSRLVKEGVIMVCGLTATDIMHINNDYNKYSTEAALLGAQFVANNAGTSVSDLCQLVYDEIKQKIYCGVVEAMLINSNNEYRKNGIPQDIIKFIRESYSNHHDNTNQNLISMNFKTDFTLVGLGAPIRIFIDDVAKRLGTKAMIPPHYEVANALGAIVGKIYALHEIEVTPIYNTEGITSYNVLGNDEIKIFKTLPEAEDFAVSEAKKGAHLEVTRRGAKGDVTISYTIKTNQGEARDCMVYLGTKVTATAVGGVGF